MIKIKTPLLLFSIGLIISLVSCEPKSDLATMQEDLKTKKTNLSTLKLEIKELEGKLNMLDTTSALKGVAVNISKVMPSHFEHYFSVNGGFEAEDYAYISPETSGQIVEILVAEGQKVKKGQLLVKLNTSIAESSITEIETALELSKVVYEKQKELWAKNIGSELDYLRAKNDYQRLQNQKQTLQNQLDMAYIKSPITGVVDDIPKNQGELAMPGQLLMKIVNLQNFNFFAEVSEAYLPFIHVGDKVNLKLSAYENKTFEAKITRIAHIINPENRSFKVQIFVKNTSGIIKPNMLAEVTFRDFEDKEALVVPSIIIKKDFEGRYVFIAVKKDGDWFAKKKYIETGRSKADETMLTAGLNIGEFVIVNGYNQVVDGSLLSVK
ncbi:MAG: hypothetical protein B7C24_12465 [Bacteroidetes bacterium 4572_77]|nr:MAG: hypothetical protein B7C24_12465 [Bacteroidetes bacterium 4572_77]